MIAGHFGLSLVAKSRATNVPVWAFALATQWLDVIFMPPCSFTMPPQQLR